ncbi:hypothetical protein [[Pseudomonas] boreopolis]|uniref:hypothetical protein n=1 Tax=Xanthomonas boreopolis TaxID=86183 RepID=UPI003D409B44
MSILKWAAVGAAGVFAYKAWQRRQAGAQPAPASVDRRETTPPHGDALAGGAPGPAVAAPAAQSSRGFGEEA